MNRKSILILIAGALAGAAVCYRIFSHRTFGADDLYVNGLVYAKKSLNLFSGTIRAGDSKHWGEYSFCNGEPCGHFESRDFGDLTTEGVYLDKSILPADVKKIIGKNVFAIRLWGECPYDANNPEYLTVDILEPDWGTFEFKNYPHMDQIARSVAKATSGLNYTFLTVDYLSDFYHPGYWYEVKYSMRNGSPILKRRDSL